MNDDCEIIYSQSNLESIKSDYEKQLSFLKIQLDEAKAYCSKKDSIITDLQLQIERMVITFDQKDEEIASLSKKQKERIDKQKSSSEKTEKDLNNAFKEITMLQDKNFSLSQENKKFIELVASQKKDIQKGFDTIKKLQEENAMMKSDLIKKPVIGHIPHKVNYNKNEEILLQIKKNLKDVHESTRNLFEDLESRIEVIKASEVDKKSETLKKAFEVDLIEIRDKLKEIMFFKDIAEGALF